MTFVPAELGPNGEELAVLSLLSVRGGGGWRVVSGSLLTMPAAWGYRSWPMWSALQPKISGYTDPYPGFDLGPCFDAEVFPGVRVSRHLIESSAWHTLVCQVLEGEVRVGMLKAQVEVSKWSLTSRITQRDTGDAANVITAAFRPVRGIVGAVVQPPIPSAGDTWAWQTPPHLKPGPDLGRIAPQHRLLHWPEKLLGVRWLGTDEYTPPAQIVIGRVEHVAWIMAVKPDPENRDLRVHLNWDENKIDPLGLSLLLRIEHDGLLLVSRATRISDLPVDSPGNTEASDPRLLTWEQRWLTVRLPRGPRRSDWGVKLLGSDGEVYDERPTAARYESVGFTLNVSGDTGPGITTVIGDRNPAPDRAEQEETQRLVTELDAEARASAAGRRFSSRGELVDYLRWRLSCRAGELLVLDPYAFSPGNQGQDAADFAFLMSLGRPIRVLTRRGQLTAAEEVSCPGLRVARLRVRLHDRVWLFGETGLLVGSSLNGFRLRPGTTQTNTTTATELPHADAALWRTRFESWWTQATEATTKAS